MQQEQPKKMSQAEFKHSLRKMDFPACAKEALPRIESIIVSRSKQNFAMALISEFIFLERVNQISKMTPLQEFQLILVLIEYFSQPGPDATRNAVFLSLFGTNLTTQRSKVLCQLISTAVSGSVAPLLSSAGTWMQQMGCTTAPSLEVAQALISDFINFSRKTPDQLKQLPMVAPHFVANFMTTASHLYLNDQRGGSLVEPPDALLDVFIEWISENPALCVAAQQPVSLPVGAIAMPVVTPFAGLIRWGVLAPLVNAERTAYGVLHFWVLESMLENVTSGPPTILNAQHLTRIVPTLQTYVSRLIEEKAKPEEDACYRKCMERFAQSLQVAFATNCMFGSMAQLASALETLPPHDLMRIILAANKRT